MDLGRRNFVELLVFQEVAENGATATSGASSSRLGASKDEGRCDEDGGLPVHQVKELAPQDSLRGLVTAA